MSVEGATDGFIPVKECGDDGSGFPVDITLGSIKFHASREQYQPVDDVDLILALDDQIAEAKAKLDELKAARAEAEDRITEQWAAIDKQSENRRGRTVYRAREFQCSTKRGMAESLREHCEAEGLDHVINTSVVVGSLKAWIRERLEYTPDGELDLSQVPASIVDSLNIHERFVVKVRKS